MRKTSRFLFFLFVLIACLQLFGLEEAFCDDSAMEAGCQECLTCVGHQFTGVADAVSLPSIAFSGYTFLDYSFQPIENPPLNLLRPPIAR